MFMAAALLMVAVGCKNSSTDIDTPPPFVLEIANSDISIDHTAQNVEFEVVCSQDINVDFAVDWLEVVEVRHDDDYVVVLRAMENMSPKERYAKIFVVAGEEERIVTLKQMGVADVMQVVIAHRNQHLDSPEWGGTAVAGTIDWGDDCSESYTEGISHDYADAEHHTATFTMSGATSFRIESIGDMDSLTIAVD